MSEKNIKNRENEKIKVLLEYINIDLLSLKTETTFILTIYMGAYFIGS